MLLENDYSEGARTACVFHGKIPQAEEMEFTVNGSLVAAQFGYRGADYIWTSQKFKDDSVLKDCIFLVFSEKCYLYDQQIKELLKEIPLPVDESIPDSNIWALQAFDKIIIMRAGVNNEPLKPLVWNGSFDGSLELAPDAKAYYSIPHSNIALWHGNRLVVPLQWASIPLEKISFDHEKGIATCQTSADTGLKSGSTITIEGAEAAFLNGVKTILGVQEQVYDEEGNLTTPASFTFSAGADSSLVEEGEGLAALYQSVDEYVLSGILEPFEFDFVKCHFRINKGSGDSIVAFAPYQQNSMIVFMRKSIWIHSGLDDIENSTVSLVTDEFGCVSARSIATIGTNIYFLSDAGVYSLAISSELNLRGAAEPLSKDIEPVTRRINLSASDKACGAYCNNRYYLAVPLDGATRNNAILVYNLLNGAWESVDVYPESMHFDTLCVAIYDGQKRVFGISKAGGISLLEEREDGDEVGMIGAAGYEVSGVSASLKTRAYAFSSPELKRFARLQADVCASDTDNYSLSATFENPDSSTETWNFSGRGKDNSFTHRTALRRTAHRAYAIFSSSQGRPELRQVVFDATTKTSDSRKA